MQKKLILSIGILSVILISLNFVSASGLCKGYDGYYHDCDNDKYFYYNNDYDDYYYKHGKYYPTRDYNYRGYYNYCGDYDCYDRYEKRYYNEPRYRDRYYRDGDRYYDKDRVRERRYDTELDYDDVEEYERTINYIYEDRYGNQNVKTTIYQKNEIDYDYNIPYYVYPINYNNDRKYDTRYLGYGSYPGYDYSWKNWEDYFYYEKEPVIRVIPWTYSDYRNR